MKTQEYYNAKPSKIGNLGADVSGAKRMHFDTYENEEERKAVEKKKAANSALKALKAEFKCEVFALSPDRERLIELTREIYALETGFALRETIERLDAISQSRPSNWKEYNRVVRKYNSARKQIRSLEHSQYSIDKLRRRYKPKHKYVETNGRKTSWKTFQAVELGEADYRYLSTYSSAVQFGNSVTDKERSYICNQMMDFLAAWKTDTRFNTFNLTPLRWSFGARGKAGSVAYYQDALKVISVNRNNIGSLIHEVGHFLDYQNNLISKRISSETVKQYRAKIKDEVSSLDLRYYLDRREVFARAFEAYCIKMEANFPTFAQCSRVKVLPDLNDELISIIENALKSS